MTWREKLDELRETFRKKHGAYTRIEDEMTEGGFIDHNDQDYRKAFNEMTDAANELGKAISDMGKGNYTYEDEYPN